MAANDNFPRPHNGIYGIYPYPPNSTGWPPADPYCSCEVCPCCGKPRKTKSTANSAGTVTYG